MELRASFSRKEKWCPLFEDRLTEIVFIGVKLDEAKICAALDRALLDQETCQRMLSAQTQTHTTPHSAKINDHDTVECVLGPSIFTPLIHGVVTGNPLCGILDIAREKMFS